MLGRKTAARAAFLLLLAACTGDAGSPLAPEPGGLTPTISDAAHAGAVPGFYFLPPMVPQPSYGGTFDAALSPRAEICELAGTTCGTVIAQYSMTSGTGSEVIRVSPTEQHYIFNWHTDDFNLDLAKHYRITVFVGQFRLGFADVDAVSTGKELKNVDTDQYIPLKDGRTLPVKFRIETGIAGAVDVEPDSATISAGQTQQFTATVTDLHGNPVAASVTWTTSAPAVATVSGTGLATGMAPGTATITATSGAASASATLTVINPNTAPVARSDTFEAIGNVTVPVAAPGVLGNDTDAEGNPLSVVAGTFPTASGGTVTLAADGSFSYLSAPGFTGTDSFDYVVSDGQAADTATAQVVSSIRVWYVKNDAAAPGDGRDASPFTTLKAAESASAAGETIFLLAGNGTTAGQDQGIVLKAGQALTGQGVSSDISATLNGQSVLLLDAGSAPRITRSGPGATIELATGNTVQGVSVASTAGAGIAGSGFGTFTAGSLSVSAVGGPALDLANGTVAASFTVLSSTGSTGVGLRLHNLAGTLTAAGGSIVGAGGVEIDGGTADITYAGDVTTTVSHVASVTGRSSGTVTLSGSLAGTGAGILVQGNTGGTVAFTGPSKVLNTGTGTAVSLLGNPGATIRFAGGGLALTTTTGFGFSAVGGGTVTVTGANNTATASGGTALRVLSTTIGSGGLTFRSISASGGANGIVLDGTGTGFGLQVTGTGSAGSGGTIQGTVGADGTSAGIGIYLNDTRNVELGWMQLADHPNFAIRGTGVVNFSMANTRVTGTNGTSEAAPFHEGSVSFEELTGSALISGSSISGGRRDNVRVVNSGGTLNRITFSGDTIGANGATGFHGVLLQPTGSAVMRVTVQGTRFTASRDQHFLLDLEGSPTADLVFTGNTLSNAHAAVVSGGGGMTIVGRGGSGAVPTLTYDISGNNFRDSDGSAITVNKGVAAGSFSGTISGNAVGLAAIPNSGSRAGSGIAILSIGRGTHSVSITNNQVRQYNNNGILLQAGGAAKTATGFAAHDAALNATVTGNVVSDPGTLGGLPFSGIALNAGTNSNAPATPDAYAVCLQMTGNTLTGSGAAGGTDFLLRQRFATTVRLPGYAGGAFDNTAVTTFVQGNNGGATGSVTSSPAGGGFVGGAACPTP
ncbi:MAG TPA: Ig-like domain-containing protein [Longimicrobiaceae bacterium]